GQAVSVGTLVVTVHDARTDTPINNAVVTANPGGGFFKPASPTATPGNYAFEVLGAGLVTINADAGEAYEKRTVVDVLDVNEIKGVFVAMAEPKTLDEETAGCCGGTNEKG